MTPLLRAAGHEVCTPTLTGFGERAHLLNVEVTLETHVQDVVGVLKYEDFRYVVPAAHSYGSMVMTAVADREMAPEEVAIFVRRVLRHPRLNTQAKRIVPLALCLDAHPLAIVRHAATQAKTGCQGVHARTEAHSLDNARNPNPEPCSHDKSRSRLLARQTGTAVDRRRLAPAVGGIWVLSTIIAR